MHNEIDRKETPFVTGRDDLTQSAIDRAPLTRLMCYTPDSAHRQTGRQVLLRPTRLVVAHTGATLSSVFRPPVLLQEENRKRFPYRSFEEQYPVYA